MGVVGGVGGLVVVVVCWGGREERLRRFFVFPDLAMIGMSDVCRTQVVHARALKNSFHAHGSPQIAPCLVCDKRGQVKRYTTTHTTKKAKCEAQGRAEPLNPPPLSLPSPFTQERRQPLPLSRPRTPGQWQQEGRRHHRHGPPAATSGGAAPSRCCGGGRCCSF